LYNFPANGFIEQVTQIGIAKPSRLHILFTGFTLLYLSLISGSTGEYDNVYGGF